MAELVALAQNCRYPGKIELDVDDFTAGSGSAQREVVWDCRKRDWSFVSMVCFETTI